MIGACHSFHLPCSSDLDACTLEASLWCEDEKSHCKWEKDKGGIIAAIVISVIVLVSVVGGILIWKFYPRLSQLKFAFRRPKNHQDVGYANLSQDEESLSDYTAPDRHHGNLKF